MHTISALANLGPEMVDIVCIGNSAMRRLVDSLNKLKVNAHFASIGHQKRLTVSSLDQLADKNSPLFGPKPLVVVDGFDNALLKPSSYEGDMMDDNFAVRPLATQEKKATKFQRVTPDSEHLGDTFNQIVHFRRVD